MGDGSEASWESLQARPLFYTALLPSEVHHSSSQSASFTVPYGCLVITAWILQRGSIWEVKQMSCNNASICSCHRMTHSSSDPMQPMEGVDSKPVMTDSENTIENTSEATTSPETALESLSAEQYEALSLKNLPQQLHMPAPKMLCRPSALRWTKPCCTRSCSENLEHVVTIQYSESQKLCPVSNQTS